MRIIFILFSLLVSMIVKSHAQTGNLNQLSQTKRDSILITVAKEGMLKYAPEWYNETLTTEVSFFGPSKSGREEEKNRQLYTVIYHIDKSKVPESWEYMAKVFIWEDSGQLAQITFGPGWMLNDIDEQPQTRSGTVKQIPYPSNLPRPF